MSLAHFHYRPTRSYVFRGIFRMKIQNPIQHDLPLFIHRFIFGRKNKRLLYGQTSELRMYPTLTVIGMSFTWLMGKANKYY